MSGTIVPFKAAVVTLVILLVVVTRPGSGLNVTINSVTLTEMTNDYLPLYVNIKMTTDTNVQLDMRLERAHHLDLNIPVLYISRGADGQIKTRTEDRTPSKNAAFYQDVLHQGSFQIIRYWDDRHENHNFHLKGHVMYENHTYYLDTHKGHNHETTRARRAVHHEDVVLTSFMDMPGRLVYLEGVVVELEKKTYDGPKGSSWISAGKAKKRSIHVSKMGQTRVKRDTGPVCPVPMPKDDMFVDVVAYVGHGLYEQFKARFESRLTHNIREHYAFMFNDIDLIYRRLETTFNLNIRLAQIVISESPDFFRSKNGDDEMVAEDALISVTEFANGRGRGILREHDHLMAFTNYDLVLRVGNEDHREAHGITTDGSLCQRDGSSSSVVEDRDLSYQTVLTAAHELAHSMGASHDGYINDCFAGELYLMSDVTGDLSTILDQSTVTNPWQMSECTVQSISDFIQGLYDYPAGKLCLTTAIPALPDIPDTDFRLRGLEMSPDEQCAWLHGTGSRYCRTTSPATICTNLWCSNPEFKYINQCFQHYAFTGTTCGKKMICLFGRCVRDLRGPDVPASCPYGDIPGAVFKDQTCTELTRDDTTSCYSQEFKTYCCDTCNKVYRPIQGCEYGDKVVNCTADMCYGDGPTCCDTCDCGEPIQDDLAAQPDADLTTYPTQRRTRKQRSLRRRRGAM
ncbi:hypothetical protein Btru_012833 [Bulinus truncatus]|nr:hypothetical protein Btru_012833 [Bulinus truncatus]